MVRAMSRTIFVVIFVLGWASVARPATVHKGCHLPKPDVYPSDVAINGSIDGTPAAVLVDYNGGTSLSMDVIVYWQDHGLSTKTITPADYGDKIRAAFVDGKIYTVNAVYRASDTHAAPSAHVVQQFGLAPGRIQQQLRREFIRYVAEPDDSTIEENCPAGMVGSRYTDIADAYIHYFINIARHYPSARWVPPTRRDVRRTR